MSSKCPLPECPNPICPEPDCLDPDCPEPNCPEPSCQEPICPEAVCPELSDYQLITINDGDKMNSGNIMEGDHIQFNIMLYVKIIGGFILLIILILFIMSIVNKKNN